MTPEDHRADIVLLRHIALVFEYAVDPARYRNTLGIHYRDVLVPFFRIGSLIEASLDPVQVQIPDPGPVRPGAGLESVVARQGIGEHAQIGSALYIVMPAEDIGATTGNTHVAQRQLEHAIGAGIVVADRVLGTAHAPDEGTGPVIGHRLGRGTHLHARHAGDALDFLRWPLRHFGLDLVHAVDTLTNEFVVLPVVLENVPQHAPDDRHIRTGANLQEVIGMGRGAGETRIDDHDRCVVLFLGLEDMLQRHRMRLGRVGTDQQDRF